MKNHKFKNIEKEYHDDYDENYYREYYEKHHNVKSQKSSELRKEGHFEPYYDEDSYDSLNKFSKGPIKTILGIFLILMLLLMIVPFYGIKQNPEPNYLPTFDELSVAKMIVPNVSGDMRNYIQVTPEIKRLADMIVTLSCNEPSKVCNAKAIYYFVQSNFNYVNDPLSFEYYKTPQESLLSRNGDCDDASILLSSLLQAIGFSTRFVFVPGHVFVEVELPEAPWGYKSEADWVSLDATCKECEFGDMHYSYSNKEKKFLQ